MSPLPATSTASGPEYCALHFHVQRLYACRRAKSLGRPACSGGLDGASDWSATFAVSAEAPLTTLETWCTGLVRKLNGPAQRCIDLVACRKFCGNSEYFLRPQAPN